MINKIVIFLIVLNVFSFANNTYELKEQDLISEIENKAPELEKKMEEQKKIIVEKIENLTGEILTKAPQNRIKYIDPTYTLDKDIPKYNQFGKYEGVLYKKGYKFNPIDYMKALPPDFIVFNVCDKAESEYVKKIMQEYEKQSRDYMLVNSGCKNRDVKNSDFNEKVYFLTKEMKDKFEIEHTVSIVYIDKERKKIAVKEVSANDEKNSN